MATDALNWNLCVAVVIAVIMANPYQFTVVRTWARLLHLGCEKVGETFAIKTIDVIDWVAFSCQGVHKHSCASSDCRLSNLEINNVSLFDGTMGSLLGDLPIQTHVFHTQTFLGR